MRGTKKSVVGEADNRRLISNPNSLIYLNDYSQANVETSIVEVTQPVVTFSRKNYMSEETTFNLPPKKP